jgi:hypothetical protein
MSCFHASGVFDDAHQPPNVMPDQSDPTVQNIATTFGIMIQPCTSKIIPDGSCRDLQKWIPRRKHTISYTVDKKPISQITLTYPTTHLSHEIEA